MFTWWLYGYWTIMIIPEIYIMWHHIFVHFNQRWPTLTAVCILTSDNDMKCTCCVKPIFQALPVTFSNSRYPEHFSCEWCLQDGSQSYLDHGSETIVEAPKDKMVWRMLEMQGSSMAKLFQDWLYLIASSDISWLTWSIIMYPKRFSNWFYMDASWSRCEVVQASQQYLLPSALIIPGARVVSTMGIQPSDTEW